MKNKSIIAKFLILASALFFSTEVFAGTATLTWDANTEPDLASYKVYYDTTSRTGTLPCANAGYLSNINVGNVTTYTFNNLTDGATYYFAVSAYDTTGNESTCSTQQSKVIPAVDSTPPTVTGITVPATASSLTVNISGFTATDATGVTGYMVNESSTAPSSGATGWSSTAPTTYTFATAGSKTLYTWAKDAAGNVSASVSGSVTITLPVSTYTIGGSVSGLSGTVVLRNNGGNNLTLSSSGSFTFSTALNSSASYAVTVFTQPSNQTCSVSSGSGTVSSANVTNVSVSCQTTAVPCTENWACSDWSACSNSSQTKTCTDSNSCGTTTLKPAVSQSCTSPVSSSGGGGGGGGTSTYTPPPVVVPPVDNTPPVTATTTLSTPPVTAPFTISNPGASSGALLPVAIRNLKIADESKVFIKEGQTITSTATIFEALVIDTDGSKVRLEIEIRGGNESFTGVPTIVSDYIPTGSTLQLKKSGIANGTYKVRARTKKQVTTTDLSSPSTSDWLDFGSKDITDFTILASSASAPKATSVASLPAIKGPFSLTTVSSEVTLLKQVLNALGFTVSNTTTKYDKDTISAVTAFQKANGLEQVGIAGPQTRAKINAAYRKLSGTPAPQASSSALTQNLKRGSASSEVTLLQTMLSKDKTLYPEQSVTGTFGPATERAVIRFQKKYGITPAVGFVGALTRAKLGEVLGR